MEMINKCLEASTIHGLSHISTSTIETLPIINLPFPKITVCPPKNTYTDLNLDLMNVGNMTFQNDLTNGNSTDSQLLEGFVNIFNIKIIKKLFITSLLQRKQTNIEIGIKGPH